MQKRAAFGMVFLFTLIISASFGDYLEGEKPPWGLAADTAYTLNSQKFNVSALGWLTYGTSDRLQLGTNFWVNILQFYNAYWKFLLLDEKEAQPAVSVGAIHYYSRTAGRTGWTADLGVNATKKLGDEYVLYGGISRFSTTSLLVNLIRGGDVQSVTGRIGLIMNNTRSWHSFAEAGLAISRLTFKDFAVGVEWASDALPFRLKLGAYFPGLVFLPVIDVSWRI